ncbi:hypothetical protein C4K39_3214 [Pseudomonas sessilinigenes]|nr:hypothetical protein C4K39_3214 [Pseudomonas sessilinigenes]
MMFDHGRLQGMPRAQAGLFCLLAAERLVPVYRAFSEKYRSGTDVNAEVLDLLFQQVGHWHDLPLQALHQQLYLMVPDTEDYSDELADQAQCAVIGTCYCIEYLLWGEADKARWAIGKVLEAIDVLDEPVEREAPREFAWCATLLELLEQGDLGDLDFIAQLRRDNQEHCVQVVDSRGR